MNATYCTKGRGQAVLGLRIEQSGHHLHWKLGKKTKPNKAEVTWQLESYNETDNEQSKQSICFLPLLQGSFLFCWLSQAIFFPNSLLWFLLLLPTNLPVQSPTSKLAKAALTWGEILDLTFCKIGSKLDFDMFNCFARLHCKKGDAGQGRNIIAVVCSPWIHNSLVVSPINIHVVWICVPSAKYWKGLPAQQWAFSAVLACWNSDSSAENRNPHGENPADLVPAPAHKLLWGRFYADSVCTCFHLLAIFSSPVDKLRHEGNEWH